MLRAVLVVVLVLVAAEARLIRKNHESAVTRGLRARGLLNDVAGPSPQWFVQNVDHYDMQNLNTFRQQYFVNDTFWGGPGSPIFLVLGGEGPLSAAYVGSHFWTGSLAQQYNAMIVAIEHRFYGQSMPTNDSSTQSLRLLTSAQALADAANFRQFITARYNAPTSQWIVFGGSYSGALAAWARLKYPQLFNGAFASSGPVNAVEDFVQYFEVFQSAVGPACASQIQKATNTIETMLQTAAGTQKLQSIFNTCAPMQTDVDKTVFLENLSDPLCEVVQYNNDNRGSGAMNIQQMCQIFQNNPDPVAAWAQLAAQGSGGACLESTYSSYVNDLVNTSAARSWVYQTCTEFGYYQTGEANDQPFSPRITLQFFRQLCRDVYGANMPLSPNTAWINTYYGGLSLKDIATNTYFGDGTVDPWHALAILPTGGQPGVQSLGTGSVTVLIEGTAHCADLYAPSANDLPQLTLARQVAQQYMSQYWL